MKTKDLSLITLTTVLPLALTAAQTRTVTPSSSQPETSAKTNHGFFIQGDFIYWHAQEESLEYALSGVNNLTTTSTGNVDKGKLYSPNFGFNPGFKVEAGYTLGAGRDWDILARYTWLRSGAHSSVSSNQLSANSHSAIFPIILHPVFFPTSGSVSLLQFGKANWHLLYQTLDLELSKQLHFPKRFSLTPHGGLKGASIQQNYHVNYELANVSNTIPGSVSFQFLDIPEKNNFFGVGLRAGLGAEWDFNKYCGLFGDLSGSLVWGTFHTHQKMTETRFIQTTGTDATPRGTLVDTHSKFTQIQPEVDAALGIHGQADLYDKYTLEANLSWEYTVWFNQNQLLLFMDSFAFGKSRRFRGNLTMQGLTLDVKFHF